MVMADLPADIQEAARAIDGSDYSSDCFELSISHEVDSDELIVLEDRHFPDDKPLNVFYIDNDGRRHGFHVDLTEELMQSIHAACRAVLTERGNRAADDRPVPISQQLEAAKQLMEMQHGSQKETVIPDRDDR